MLPPLAVGLRDAVDERLREGRAASSSYTGPRSTHRDDERRSEVLTRPPSCQAAVDTALPSEAGEARGRFSGFVSPGTARTSPGRQYPPMNNPLVGPMERKMNKTIMIVASAVVAAATIGCLRRKPRAAADTTSVVAAAP